MAKDGTQSPIDPYSDLRVSHCRSYISGVSYHYVVGEPQREPRATVFLVHGFQDLWYGWRHQIPALLSQGLRVVAIDCIGYGETDSPQVPPESIQLYGFKRAADDIAALAKLMGLSEIILGGHDWGGMIVSRVYLYHPTIVKAIFTLGTPYLPPSQQWLEFDAMVVEKPTFKYQKHFGSVEFEDALQSRRAIQLFFNATFGGHGPNGELGFSTAGALVENWPILQQGTQLTQEEMDYYVDQYQAKGLHGPRELSQLSYTLNLWSPLIDSITVNWYRNRRQNYEDERLYVSMASDVSALMGSPGSPPKSVIEVPYLFVQSLKDPFLPPNMSEGMEKYIPRLERQEVDAGHFCHMLSPDKINMHITRWLKDTVLADDVRLEEA